jgi:DNA-binding MarR family transcriptional regulator
MCYGKNEIVYKTSIWDGGIPQVSKWTFLTNHAVVLLSLVQNPQITGIQIAQFVGITERAVRTILSDLEREGYISKTKTGKRVQYTINYTMPLRRKSQQHRDIGRLLRVLSGKRKIWSHLQTTVTNQKAFFCKLIMLFI